MKREERLVLIEKIISGNQVLTQSELKSILESKGIKISQTSLSRDMHELNIAKKHDHDKSFYIILPKLERQIKSPLKRYIKDLVLKVNSANVNVIIHTRLEAAPLLASAFDGEQHPNVLGIFATSNNLLLICKNEKAAQNLVSEIENDMLI